VNSSMSCELIGSRERFVALFASIGLCAGVGTEMFRQIRRFRECFFTMWTFKRLLAVMRPFVNGERARNGERFPAAGVVAKIGLLLRMPPHMLL